MILRAPERLQCGLAAEAKRIRGGLAPGKLGGTQVFDQGLKSFFGS
jgi:hypothetical protein